MTGLLITTGELARLLDTTEPRLGELVRRGHIEPRPQVVSGRRLWTRRQARQAAAALGFDDDQIRQLVDAPRPGATTRGGETAEDEA